MASQIKEGGSVSNTKWAESVWTGCYEMNWANDGLCLREALIHPAKISPLLSQRIYQHLLDNNYVKPGALIIDPFGGIAGTALHAMAKGLRWVGIELESRFVKLGRANLDYWEKKYGLTGGVLLQGDSRFLGKIVREAQASGVVSSPPFLGSRSGTTASGMTKGGGPCADRRQTVADGDRLGNSEGQLAAMDIGDHTSVVSSPPYNLPMSQDHNGSKGGNRGTTPSEQGAFVKYGNSPGQLEGMTMGEHAAVVSSPPYANEITGTNAERETAEHSRDKRRTDGGSLGTSIRHGGYGTSEGNLSELKPGDVDEKERSDTFWSASKVIVSQCFDILPSGGVAIWVVKNFVRNGAIVPFSDQWRQLCESCGFVMVEWIQASFLQEQKVEGFFGEETKTKSRKGFFRRLHEKKHPELAIDYEDVLIMRKP